LEVVVHLVDEPLAKAMNICAIDFASDLSETVQAGLALIPSSLIRSKRIVEAPVAFECEKIALLEISPGRKMAIAKVLLMQSETVCLIPKLIALIRESIIRSGECLVGFTPKRVITLK